jgi:hypothetical protein
MLELKKIRPSYVVAPTKVGAKMAGTAWIQTFVGMTGKATALGAHGLIQQHWDFCPLFLPHECHPFGSQ